MVNASGPIHPADVIAALSKKGISLRALARQSKISVAGLSYGLRHPAERAESIIARALETTPVRLWPNRFDSSGQRIIRRLARTAA